MSLGLIEDYIASKISKPGKGKPSFGVAWLKDIPKEDLFDNLQMICQVIKDEIAAGIVRENGEPKLTQTAMRIGYLVGKVFEEDDMCWKDQVRIGDVFIEAFYANDFIYLRRTKQNERAVRKEMKEDGKPKFTEMENWEIVAKGNTVLGIENRLTEEYVGAEDFEEFNVEIIYDLVHVLGPTKEWLSTFEAAEKEDRVVTLVGTTFTKPHNITRLMQRPDDLPKYPIVKGWSTKVEHLALFSKMKSSACLQGLNNLQQVPWRINEKVLEALKTNKNAIVSADECEDEFEEVRRVSKRFELDHIIAKADLIGRRQFYCLFDFDYRGRIYNRETIFNFQGSDTARGILLFDEAKPVTERGFDWLCIHAACSMNMSYKIDDIPEWCESDYKTHLEKEGLETISVDKMTLKDRINWTLNHLGEIQMTAELNTISGAAEKPVSYLAVCHEINNYIKYTNSGLIYFSSLPVPIDGSNNGWQHLGAISKDRATGELVGLVPVSIQNDFYVQTAKRLIAITKDDRRSEILSDMPMKKIRKAISKRGSMTRAYSAGAQRIAQNMINDLRKDDLDKKYNIDAKMCMGFSRDLVEAIKQTCTGPLDTMKYFQQVAAEIVEVYDCMRWVTPSGFVVEYRKYHKKRDEQRGTIRGYNINRSNGRPEVKHRMIVDSTTVDQRGFACGVSPNYIHSLDASHMAIVLTKWTGAFGAVHDSFSTHASEVDDLLLLTKDVFVRMYDHENYFDVIQDSIKNQIDFLVERPELGDLDIKEVMNSDYFFA